MRWPLLSATFLAAALAPDLLAKDPPASFVDAAGRGDREAVERFLDDGMHVDTRARGGLTALNAARIKGQREIIELLLARGADRSIEMPPPDAVLDSVLGGIIGEDSPGAAVLVARDGEVVLRKGAGYADLAHKAPITSRTKFRIGSVTKQFTAAAVLKLQEAGKIDVEDRLSKFLPDFPRGDEVTVHHLLTHTSGIRSYTDKPEFLARVTARTEPEELIAWFRDDPYDFSPGERQQYNNSGYFLLGRIVEKVSGRSYGDFLEESFFEPLGMADTGVHRSDLVLEDEATGYAFDDGSVKEALDWDMSWAGGAGALYSTADDLFRWNEAVFGGKVLGAESLEAAFRPETTGQETSDEAPRAGYGYGWATSEHRGLRVIEHGGGLHGFLSYLGRYPEEKLTIVVLTNASPPIPGLDPGGLAREVAELFLWKEMKPREARTVDPSVSPEKFADFAGRYDYGGVVLTVTPESDRLFAQLTGQGRFEIFPKSETEFFWKVVDAEITFVRDKSGKVVEAVHRQNGVELKVAKLPDVEVARVDPKVYDAYVGRYDAGGGAAFLTVSKERGRLFAQLTGQPKLEVFPSSETEFFWKDINAKAEFEKDAKGKVTRVVVHQGGRTIELPRVE